VSRHAPRITDIRIFRFDLPFVSSVYLKGRAETIRSGLLIRLEDETRRFTWGEASPLPGFSRESLDQATRELQAIRARLSSLSRGAATIINRVAHCAPSVRFAVESACEALGGAIERLPVQMAGLLDGEMEIVLREARRLKLAGYVACKLKVGRIDVDSDARRVRAVAEALGPGVALRLDANRAWSMEQAETFYDRTADCAIEYVEEPLVDAHELPALVARRGVPVALDETLTELQPGDLRQHAYATAFVIKPTLTGWNRALEFALEAADLGRRPVLSASYESGVGMRHLIALAGRPAFAGIPAGLDTYRRLAADVAIPRLDLGGPVIDPTAAGFEHVQVDESLLEEIV
jgi:o-succinylbenzoate synthase